MAPRQLHWQTGRQHKEQVSQEIYLCFQGLVGICWLLGRILHCSKGLGWLLHTCSPAAAPRRHRALPAGCLLLRCLAWKAAAGTEQLCEQGLQGQGGQTAPAAPRWALLLSGPAAPDQHAQGLGLLRGKLGTAVVRAPGCRQTGKRPGLGALRGGREGTRKGKQTHTVQKGRLRSKGTEPSRDLQVPFQYLVAYKEAGNRLLGRAACDKTRGGVI